MRIIVVVALLVACKSGDDQQKVDYTRVLVKKLALEAYPQWAVRTIAQDCPRDLRDLLEFTNLEDTNDPWGQPLKMTCGPTNPPDVKGIGVVSFGPDKREGTADDITSWQK